MFRRIAPELNGDIPAGTGWHRQLLEDMTLALTDIRPPVLRPESAAALDRYLDFRHKFRNLYFFQLEWALLLPLLSGLDPAWRLVREDLIAFIAWLDAMAAAR